MKVQRWVFLLSIAETNPVLFTTVLNSEMVFDSVFVILNQYPIES